MASITLSEFRAHQSDYIATAPRRRGRDAADTLLTDNPLALLVGMLLDQQVR